MPRFPAHHFQALDFRPHLPSGNGQFMHRPRGFPGPQQFSNFHPESARFQGPHGRGMPPDQFFQRGPRASQRGGMAGRPERFPMHGHAGQPHLIHRGVEHGHGIFNRPSYNPKNYKNFQAEQRVGPSDFNRKPGPHRKHVGQQQPKQKKTKQPKEINYSHYCDVCDRGFQSDELLKSHVAEHVKCKENDCRFVAHPKVIKVHYKLHHGPGSKRIRWLDTPEEIQKWRNERRKNYPTAENIAKKAQMVEQREKQGNVLGTKQFGKMRRNHRGTKGSRRLKHRKMVAMLEQTDANQIIEGTVHNDQASPKKRKLDKSLSHSSPPPDTQGTKISDALQPNQGTEADRAVPQPSSSNDSTRSEYMCVGHGKDADSDPLSLLASVENDSGDEDISCSRGVNSVAEVAPKGTFGALGSLASCYASDSEESCSAETGDDAGTTIVNGAKDLGFHSVPEQCSTEKHTSLKNPSASTPDVTAQKTVANLHCSSGTSATTMDISSAGLGTEKKYSSTSNRKRRRAAIRAAREEAENRAKQRKSTLLEMLLAPEIRKERNIILQCVRHIVKNDFFQDSSR